MKVKKKVVYCLFSLVLLAEVIGANSQSTAATRCLNTKKLSMKTKGKYQLRLKGVKNAKVKWKSSNKKIATVNNGLVKAKRKGKCIVTAKYLKKKYQCKILVSSGNDSNQDANSFSDKEKSMVYMSAEINSETHLLVVNICNESGMDISINNYFTLEKSDGKNWYPVDLKSGSYFEEVAIMVPAHSHYLQNIDLERYFDTLTEGSYRIRKTFNEKEDNVINAEFSLNTSRMK